MATVPQIIASLEVSADRADTSSEQMYDVANGPASGAGSTVATDSGPVPTLNKWFADNTAAIQIAPRAVADITSLRNLPNGGIPRALTFGYSQVGDGGGAEYWLDTTDTTSADNGVSVIVSSAGGRWKLLNLTEINLRSAGMHPTRTSTQNKTALVAAIALALPLRLPAGLYLCDPGVNFGTGGFTLRGDGIFKSILKLRGTNTTETLLTNGLGTSASWGSGGRADLSRLSLVGNWDGSATLADADWTNTGALLKMGAGAGVRLTDVAIQNNYGHGASFYRLGYCTITRPKVNTNRKNGLHFEAPSGADAITSTHVVDGDMNSNRGVGCIYVKNGVGFWVTGGVYEDASSGVYLDGVDNRNVTIDSTHSETCTNGMLHFVGSGLNTALVKNFGDHDVTRTNPANQRLYAFGNTGMINTVEGGFDGFSQDVEFGKGSTTFSNFKLGFFGTANTDDVLGRVSWRSNNNNNASVPAAEIRAVQKGNVNQNFGSLEFGTGNNGLVYRFQMNQNGHMLPMSDLSYTLGLAGTNRLLNVFSQNITLSPPAAATPANNGEMTFQLTSNTQLTIRVKGSDGVVRSANLTLA